MLEDARGRAGFRSCPQGKRDFTNATTAYGARGRNCNIRKDHVLTTGFPKFVWPRQASDPNAFDWIA